MRFSIVARLGNMRSAVEWTVYPDMGDGSFFQIQSDHRICRFDKVTGKGMISKHKANYACNIDLMPMLGATEIVVPTEVIEAAKAAQPHSGDHIGGHVFVA